MKYFSGKSAVVRVFSVLCLAAMIEAVIVHQSGAAVLGFACLAGLLWEVADAAGTIEE